MNVRLISSAEVQDTIDQLQDGWGCDWRDDPLKRLALDTLHDCELALRAFEDAARIRNGTAEADRTRAVSMAAAVFGMPDEPDEPARLRVGGAL